MSTVKVNGVSLYYEVTGKGFPLVWSHEMGGGYESWDPQVRFFSRRYQVITYNARGYPPSSVPQETVDYSQEKSVEDLYSLLKHIGVDQAYVGGLSMGGSVALAFAIAHPEMTKALIVAGTGTGATNPGRFSKEADAVATRIETEGIKPWAEEYARGSTRVQFLRKDPAGWEVFRQGVVGHSPVGTAHTLRGVQGKRPPVLSLEAQLRGLTVPTLIIAGDEDNPCIEPALFMKRHIPRSGIVILPQTGHTCNLEEPDGFNRAVLDFLTYVEAGKWPAREARGGFAFMDDASQPRD